MSRVVLMIATGRSSSWSQDVELKRATSPITVRWVAKDTEDSSRSAQAWGEGVSSLISRAISTGTALSSGLDRRNPPRVIFSSALRSAPVPVAASTSPPRRDGSVRAASWATSPPME